MKSEPSTTAFGHLGKLVSKRKLEKPLPIPYDLPCNYPSIVMNDLAQNKLTGKARAKCGIINIQVQKLPYV